MILLVAEASASVSIAEALSEAGWEVLLCSPEKLAQHLRQEQVQGVVIRTDPDAEVFCLHALQAAQPEVGRPVLLLTEDESVRLAVALAQPGGLTAAAPDQIGQVQAWARWLNTSGRASVSEQLRHVRRELSRLNHDLKNPLAIISGNAQFLRELIRMQGDDDDLERSLADIEEACRQIHALLQRLVVLRDALPT